MASLRATECPTEQEPEFRSQKPEEPGVAQRAAIRQFVTAAA